MEPLVKILLLCLLGALLGGLFNRSNPELGLVFSVALLLVGFYALSATGRDLIRAAQVLVERSGLSVELFLPLLKTMAIALIVRLGAAFCRDASQSTLAVLLELGGTICALLAALPLLQAVLALVEDWL